LYLAFRLHSSLNADAPSGVATPLGAGAGLIVAPKFSSKRERW